MSHDAKCPKCGSAGGYTHRIRATLEQFHSFDGEIWNTEVHHPYNAGGKIKRCADCNADITKYVDSLATTKEQS